jgi:hypothetical protein
MIAAIEQVCGILPHRTSVSGQKIVNAGERRDDGFDDDEEAFLNAVRPRVSARRAALGSRKLGRPDFVWPDSYDVA